MTRAHTLFRLKKSRMRSSAAASWTIPITKVKKSIPKSNILGCQSAPILKEFSRRKRISNKERPRDVTEKSSSGVRVSLKGKKTSNARRKASTRSLATVAYTFSLSSAKGRAKNKPTRKRLSSRYSSPIRYSPRQANTPFPQRSPPCRYRKSSSTRPTSRASRSKRTAKK